MLDAMFTSMARAEERLHPDAVLLPDFPRSIQLDSYSCGAKSTYMILKYFGRRCTPATVDRELGTDDDGTSPTDIKQVLRNHGLKVEVHTSMDLRQLKSAIKAGSPVLVSLYDGWHYSVVYGYDSEHIFVMNPSLGEMGSVKCAVRLSTWREMFDRWGIIVKQPR